MDLVLRNAHIVDPYNKVDTIGDIGIEAGKVAALGLGISALGGREIDCTGKTVLPGIIDMHVHVTNALGGHNGYQMIAKTGVTTAVDFAGPIDDITAHLKDLGCGLNVGCIDSILPANQGKNPNRQEVSDFCDRTLAGGALGVKLLGGHFPLTPDATRLGIEEANRRRVMVAFHAGSTENRSDIYGMKEAVDLAKGQRMLLAHINAYCRGKRYHYLEELRDAFAMLRENPNLIADSHLASMNGTMGTCENGAIHDVITINCLELFGRPATEDGLAQAIQDGLVRVQAQQQGDNVLLEKQQAYDYWREHGTKTMVSFPANLPSVAVTCAVERVTLGGDFLIPMTSTDGGGIPRNNLIGRMLSLYHMGYLSLAEIVQKCAINPASAFGFTGKGHLGVGADGDITILDDGCHMAVQSFAMGREIMKNGVITGSGGTLLCTQHGAAQAQKLGLDYSIADVGNGMLYRDI